MYASKLVVFFLAFLVALVSTAPLPHHYRRSKCRHTSVSVAGATPTRAALEVPPSTDSPTPSSSPSSAEPPTESSKSDHSSFDSSSGDDSMLFPLGRGIASWTTSPSLKDARSLSDETLSPTKVLSELSHNYVKAPDGKPAMQAIYKEGSYSLHNDLKGGFSFYATGPKDVDISTAKEATFSYSVFFQKGFKWQLGGKLPGLYGGNSPDEAVSCSGGKRSDKCFSVRLMFRKDGEGEEYTYLPPTPPENKKVCNVAPMSDCNPTYGASVGRGSFSFEDGKWTTVAEHVILNDVGQANGKIELYVNGGKVISVDGLELRTSEQGLFRGLMMQTFFGGSEPDFASPENQDAWFSDFSVAIHKKL